MAAVAPFIAALWRVEGREGPISLDGTWTRMAAANRILPGWPVCKAFLLPPSHRPVPDLSLPCLLRLEFVHDGDFHLRFERRTVGRKASPPRQALRASLSPRWTSLDQTRRSLALPPPISHVERSPGSSARPHSSSGPRPHQPHLAPHPHRQSPAEGHSSCSATESEVSNQTQESENNLF